ncbi:hypothetical protein AB0D13_42015 [Streptomyces sp. NPDC048430]|uniref:hypothetical protein n=1 Tax=Streptomyces sp. NPDC048430 TaxID=3155388 RepID=UPI0034485BD0
MDSYCEDNRATELLKSVLELLDDGVHVLTAAAMTPDGPQTTMALVENYPGVTLINAEEIDLMVNVLSMMAGMGNGGLLVRSQRDASTRRVFGWHISGLMTEPVGSAELFDAYCTDPATGEAMPLPPNTVYTKAPALH